MNFLSKYPLKVNNLSKYRVYGIGGSHFAAGLAGGLAGSQQALPPSAGETLLGVARAFPASIQRGRAGRVASSEEKRGHRASETELQAPFAVVARFSKQSYEHSAW